MNYAAEMGLGAMMYILSPIRIDAGIQKLLRGDSHTEELILLLSFFKIRNVD
jgi:hypothetical protein